MRRGLVLTLVLVGLASLAFLPAQQLKVLAPHRPVAPKLVPRKPWGQPAVHQSAVGGLWMIDASTKSSLYLKNGLKTDSLSVTPSLYLSNGVRYMLPAVTLEPSGVAVIDINQALAEKGIAPYATLYGYAEIDYQWPWAPVCATIRSVDVVNGLIFTYGLDQPPAVSSKPTTQSANSAAQSFEGLWWKQEKGVSGFVALSNVTDSPIHATVQDTDNQGTQLSSHPVTISPHATKLVRLDDLQSATTDSGGVYVVHDGVERGLAINGALVDESVGYSARLPLLPSPPASTGASKAASANTAAELGLMTGFADPMMNFPAGTVFTPYSVVRNISDQPISVTPTLWWMADGKAQSTGLSEFSVAPHQTVNLNVPELLATAGLKDFNGSVNLVLETLGQSGSLVMASGSVDQRNTYVFEVTPRGVGESASRSVAYWSIANGDDTMVTLWNPADEAQHLVFTLFFSGGEYAYPIQLGPRATRTLNVSEIAHAGIPDAEGRTVPAGIQEGSAEIAGSQGENQHILVNIDVGVYNVRKATCGTVCISCNGVTSSYVTPSPFSTLSGGSSQESFYEQWNTGTQYNVTNQSSWYSSSNSIATVSNSGLVTGVAAGHSIYLCV